MEGELESAEEQLRENVFGGVQGVDVEIIRRV